MDQKTHDEKDYRGSLGPPSAGAMRPFPPWKILFGAGSGAMNRRGVLAEAQRAVGLESDRRLVPLESIQRTILVVRGREVPLQDPGRENLARTIPGDAGNGKEDRGQGAEHQGRLTPTLAREALAA